jgi:hypothetical protein
MTEESPSYVYKRENFAPTYFTDKHAQSMTLRDHFAGLAMHLATNLLREDYLKDLGDDWHWDDYDWEVIADSSYAMADAMLRAREA